MKKYIVIGGFIWSKWDEERHYVNARKLCDLYGVNPKECILYEENFPEQMRGMRKDLPVLRPRYHGDYDILRRKHGSNAT